MDAWAWGTLAFLGASFAAWAGPKAWSFLGRAIANEVLDGLSPGMEERLQPLWQEDLEEAVAPIHKEVEKIRREVTLNGGGSMKDVVTQIQRDIEAVLIETRN